MIISARFPRCVALLLACAAASLWQSAIAANSNRSKAEPILLGQRFEIHSKLLDEDREVLVHLPNQYAQSKQRYPVLIVLDGNKHLLHASGVVDFLSDNGLIPEMIVIAVPNMRRRMRDLTAPILRDEKQREEDKHSPVGGADVFANFLADELMPWVDLHYRTAPYRVLTGHSLGGLFNMIALLDRPDAFQAHIAASPSLWWDQQAYVKLAQEKLGTLKQPHFLFIGWGDNENTISRSGQKLVDWLTTNQPASLTWKHRYYPDDTHGTTPHRTLYDGLSALYQGWTPDMNMHDLEGPDFVGSKDFPALLAAHQAARSRKYGYDVAPQPGESDALTEWFVEQKRYDDALAAAQRNVALFPEYAGMKERLGRVLTEMGRPAEAIPFYEAAAKQPGEYDDIWSSEIKLRKLREDAKKGAVRPVK